MPDVFGYGWKAGHSKQVVYLTAGNRIHELSCTGGNWSHADLTAITGAPASASRVKGFAWEGGKSKHVVYATADGHIHELSMKLGGSWQHLDVTAKAGAPTAFLGPYGVPFNGYAWESGNTKQIVYQGNDEHIHELYAYPGGAWKHADVTILSCAPTGSLINGYAWEAGKSKQIVFSSFETVHEMYVTAGGVWNHANLTKLAGAPPQTHIVNGYSWEAGKSKQVVYRTEDGHVHELVVTPGGSWTDADLTAIANAPIPHVVLDGYGWDLGNAKQVAFLGTPDAVQALHELSVLGGQTWHYANLTKLTGAPDVCQTFVPLFSGDEAHGYQWPGEGKQVVYIAKGGHIHELWTNGGSWHHLDITANSGDPLPLSSCV